MLASPLRSIPTITLALNLSVRLSQGSRTWPNGSGAKSGAYPSILVPLETQAFMRAISRHGGPLPLLHIKLEQDIHISHLLVGPMLS
jgi:hypothetical protein